MERKPSVISVYMNRELGALDKQGNTGRDRMIVTRGNHVFKPFPKA